MPELIYDIAGYLRAVFIASWRWIGILVDMLGILLFCFPSSLKWLIEDEPLTRAIGSVVFFVSFLVANFFVYRELHVGGADIRLKVLEQYFSPSSGSRCPAPFRQIVRRSDHGFNDQGLPDWASLYAKIEVANFGREEGELIREFHKSKTTLPDLFNLEVTSLDFHPRARVRDRDRWSADLFFDILYTVQDPHSFARELKGLVESDRRYKVVIRYWTKRVDSESRPRELTIEGNFELLYEKVLEHWGGYGFKNLVELGCID